MNSQDFRSLQEAYREVYQEQELDEGAAADVAARAAKLARRRNQSSQQKDTYKKLSTSAGERANPVTRGDSRRGLTSSERTARRESDVEHDWGGVPGKHGTHTYGKGGITKNPRKLAQQKARGQHAEQVDIYDIILSHLLDEGYAETPEAAEVIMVNMSEEWRDSIVEEFDELDEGKVELDQERRSRMGRQIGKKVRSAEAEYSLSKDTMYPKGLRGAMEKGARKKVGQAQKIMGALKSAQKSDG
jgi:hypothetical protein